MLEEIHTALQKTHPADMYQIKRYIAWVGFRRRMHNEFYLVAHWLHNPRVPQLMESRHAHWI